MMENIKEIPYGIANFVEVAEQNMYYVDKNHVSAFAGKTAPEPVLYPSPPLRQEYLFEYAACVL